MLANKRTIFYYYTNFFYIKKHFKQNKNFIRK